MRLKLSETLKEIAAAVADRSDPDLKAIRKELNSVRKIYPYLTPQVECLANLIDILRQTVAGSSVKAAQTPHDDRRGMDSRNRMPVYLLLTLIGNGVLERNQESLAALGADLDQAQKRIAGADKMAPAMQALVESCRELVSEGD